MSQQPHEDPIFRPFRLSLLNRRDQSQIQIAEIQLRHIFFEEAAVEFLDLLQNYLIAPILLQRSIHFYEFVESLRNFFAEGATITMDPSLNYYTPEEFTQFISHFDPALHFSFFCPSCPANQSSHQTIVHNLESQNLYLTDLYHLQLLQ